MSLPVALGVLLLCFVVLLKCASWFVDGAVGIAEHLRVPKVLVGIVLVSVATTAPELFVSVQSALSGYPEIALGNAVGSVIADDGLALGLGALAAQRPVLINPYLLKTTGIFLVCVDLVAYAMAFDGTLSRVEGAVLLVLFCAYLCFVCLTRRKSSASEAGLEELVEIAKTTVGRGLPTRVGWFVAGLVGVLLASRGVVASSVAIAEYLNVSEAVIGLTVIAIGTSLPEMVTSVTACYKGHGGIAVGNILGADILNVCWIAGASAAVSPLIVETRMIHFSFPAMLLIVFTMLLLMRTGHRLTRAEGLFLCLLYCGYLLLAGKLFL